MLHSQQVELDLEESKKPSDEKEIERIKASIDSTMKKLKAEGC